jgi:hypothetical protein
MMLLDLIHHYSLLLSPFKLFDYSSFCILPKFTDSSVKFGVGVFECCKFHL